MATTEHFYTGNGSTTTFAFTFPYLSNSDVKVELDDVLKTENSSGQTNNDYTISNTNIVFNSAPASSVAIHIYRNTNVDTAQATYAAGSSIRAVDLNNNQTQVLYSSQEAIDQLVQTSGLANSAVTSAKIADGTIATGDIADSAVSTAKIADAAVTTSKINDNAVTMSKLGSGVLPSDVLVQTDNLVDGTITNVDINNSANISGSKLADDSVSLAKLGSGVLPSDISVGTDNIVDGSIRNVDIQNTAAIAGTKITPDFGSQNISTTGTVSAESAILSKEAEAQLILKDANTTGTAAQTGIHFTNSDDTRLARIGPHQNTNNILFIDNDSQEDIQIRTNSGDNKLTVRHAGGIETGASNFTGNITVSGTVDGRDVASDGTKLDTIATNADVTSTKNIGDLANVDTAGVADGKILKYSTGSGAFIIADDGGGSGGGGSNDFFISTLSPAFDGSTTAFTVTNAPSTAQQILISIDGVIQKPNSGTGQPSEGFTLSGSTVTFSSAPTSGSSYHVVVFGSALNIGVPSNDSVSTAKIVDANVTTDKIANGAVVTNKIANDAIDNTKIAGQTIQSTNIAPLAITTGKIADANVTTAKIADDAVTTDKLANSINTEIAANTAKVSNATHTGDVTGSTALTIANNAVNADKLADSTITNAKVNASAAIAGTKISPDFGSQNIVTTGTISGVVDIADDTEIRLGNADDCTIKHVASDGLTKVSMNTLKNVKFQNTTTNTNNVTICSRAAGTDDNRHMLSTNVGDVPMFHTDINGNCFHYANVAAGRTRSDADSPTSNFRHGPHSLTAYSGRTDDSTGYRAAIKMSACDYLSGFNDSSILYYVDSGSDSTGVTWDQDQKFSVKQGGQIEGMSNLLTGRVKSDERSNNNIQYSSVETYVQASHSSNRISRLRSRNSDNTNDVLFIQTAGGVVIKFESQGNGRFDGGADVGNASDYAEYFEWLDGNTGSADRRGITVVMDGEKIRPATDSDDTSKIIGVVSANPAVVGDSAWSSWQAAHKKDAYGSWVTEDKEYLIWNEFTTNSTADDKTKVANPQPDITDPNVVSDFQILVSDIEKEKAAGRCPQEAIDQNLRITRPSRVYNESYDPTKTYEPRSARKEWDAIGLLGKLVVRRGQPIGANWILMKSNVGVDPNDNSIVLDKYLVR